MLKGSSRDLVINIKLILNRHLHHRCVRERHPCRVHLCPNPPTGGNVLALCLGSLLHSSHLSQSSVSKTWRWAGPHPGRGQGRERTRHSDDCPGCLGIEYEGPRLLRSARLYRVPGNHVVASQWTGVEGASCEGGGSRWLLCVPSTSHQGQHPCDRFPYLCLENRPDTVGQPTSLKIDTLLR